MNLIKKTNPDFNFLTNIYVVTWLCGSGKTTFCDLLAIKKGFEVIKLDDVLKKILKRDKKKLTNLNLRNLRNELKTRYGNDAIGFIFAEYIAENYSINTKNTKNLIIDGIYTKCEYNYLKNKFKQIKLISILTNTALRYDRLKKRKERKLNINNAIARDIHEIENLEKSKLLVLADYFLLNNSSKTNFKKDILQQLKKIK